jgi:hypothetical protein
MAAARSLPPIRLSAFALAALIVMLVTAAALLSRVALLRQDSVDHAPVVSLWPSRPTPNTDYRIRIEPRATAPSAEAASSPSAPPTLSASSAAGEGFAAMRCATAEGRRQNPHLCGEGREFARPAFGDDIAPAPVEGVRTNEGALERTILRAARARVENYARGESQRYADPREDPLYEAGTDPADAANRPCPAGQIGQGDGSGLTGRTCQPLR